MKDHDEWINRANSAYQYAITLTNDEVFFEDKCYQAQQAAEKAIKGLLIYFGEDPEYTHDITKLLNVLEKYVVVDDNIMKTSFLTQYAIITRYPGAQYEATEEMYLEAIELAKNCLEWVEKKINK